MERIEELIGRVEQTGNVINFSRFNEIQDFDELLRCLDRQGQYSENIVFCSPDFYNLVKSMLNNINAYHGNKVYGYFNNEKTAGMGYIVDLAVHRGSYEFYFIVKPMKGAVVCPIDCPEDSFTRNSIRVNLEI